jgi:4-diphosphocytidyl-2-C-methyl-D-erythritol kinase
MPHARLNTPLRAYAKINIGLQVVRKRPDGYHDIETIFHRIDLFDEITLTPSDTIVVESTDPAAPGDSSNTCHQAAHRLRDRLGASAGVRCRVSKRIPVGAGLGGGSSDAASVLRGLPALWGSPASEQMLKVLALELGSDVPYFLGTGSAFACGRGEQLEYFPLDLPYAICVCYPNIKVETAWAYGQVTPRLESRPDLRSTLRGALKNPGAFPEIVNDFEGPVIRQYPVIGEVKRSLINAGSFYASMSGSGSSMFGFFDGMPAAETAARSFRNRGFRAFVTPPHFGT